MAEHYVGAGGDVQAALDAAAGGDTVILEKTALFQGAYRCKEKGNTQDILIRSNTPDNNLPASGYRITPSFSGQMARIRGIAGGLPALRFDRGATHWRLFGLEFEANPNGYNDILQVGNNTNGGTPYTSYEDYQLYAWQPEFVEIDRCLVRGDPFKGQKRGIYLNGRYLTVINSWIDTIFGVGQDAQAIACLNGDGPYHIENCFLEGAAETFLTGGADPAAYTSAELAASPAPTVNTATLTNFRIGNGGVQHSILSQGPMIGRRIAIRITSNSVHHAICDSQVGNSIHWTPDAPAVPLSGAGSDIRWGANVDNLIFRRNYLYKRLAWKDAFLAAPTGVQLSADYSTGSIPAGTYYIRVQAVNPNGYNQQEYIGDASAQVSITLTQTGSINVSWNPVANAASYRSFGYANNAPDRFWASTATNVKITSLSGTLRAFSASGTKPVVKTHFELKTGTNVIAEDCVAENHWLGADLGHPLWLKAVNQEGKAPFAETGNVVVRNWKFTRCEGHILFSGQEFYTGNNRDKPVRMHDVTVENILFEGASTARVFHFSNAPDPVTIDHITALGTHVSGIASFYLLGAVDYDLILRNSLWRRMEYGVLTPGYVEGTASLDALTANGGSYVFTKNALQTETSTPAYPAGNFFPTEAQFQAAFVNYNGGIGGDYRIVNGHAWKGAGTDGKDLGCDIDQLDAAIAGVIEGVPESGGEIIGGTFFRLTSAQAYLPSAAYATIRMRGSHRTIEFQQGTTDEALFPVWMPRYYQAGDALRFTISGVADSTTTSQKARMEIAFERIANGVVLGDYFPIVELFDWNPPATSGQPGQVSIVVPSSALVAMGLAGGDLVRIRLRRYGGSVDDNLSGSFMLTRMEVRKE